MDLSQKLEFYKKAAQGRSAETEKQPAIPAHVKALQEHFKGEIVYDEAPVLRIDRRIDGSAFCHESVDLSLLSRMELEAPVPRQQCVFFDLETTGLAGGAGTFAFLIGFAWWEDDAIVSRQFFLPDFGRESSLFNDLKEWLQEFDYIVSYNGKSYDLPLLNNRFVLNRVDNDLRKLTHIDLIHLCRRLFKDSVSSCSLQSMEQLLLGVVRDGDIPGFMIPQAYFDFVRYGIVHDVVRLIEHNYRDIVSLAMIMDSLHFLKTKPFRLPLDSSAVTRLARLGTDLNDTGIFAHLEAHSDNGQIFSADYHFWKSLAHKRAGEWETANNIWQMLSAHRQYGLAVLEEQAKYFEHIQKNLQAAFSVSRRALEMLELSQELGRAADYGEEWQTRFEKRAARLQEKIRRGQSDNPE